MANHVLVIDDNNGIRESFILALEGTSFIVDTASTGEEGLKKAKKERPDIIFLDIKMPGSNGIETLQRLVKDFAEVPVYIITAFCQEYMGELEELRAKGISFEICCKPLGRDQILSIVNSLIG